jgi:hypothetical protein
LVAIASFIVVGEEPPDAKDGGQAVIDYYVDDKDKLMVGAVLESLAAMLLVFFFAHVSKVLRAARGEGGTLWMVPLIGAAILATGLAIDGMISIALAEAGDDIDPAAAQALQALWENDWLTFQLGGALILWSVGISVVRDGALPKWLGWVLILLGVVAFTPIGFAAIVGLAVWVLIVSVMLTLRARSGPAA